MLESFSGDLVGSSGLSVTALKSGSKMTTVEKQVILFTVVDFFCGGILGFLFLTTPISLLCECIEGIITLGLCSKLKFTFKVRVIGQEAEFFLSYVKFIKISVYSLSAFGNVNRKNVADSRHICFEQVAACRVFGSSSLQKVFFQIIAF